MNNTLNEEYQLIKNSNLFDPEYYLSKRKIDIKQIDPILDYCVAGYKLGLDPSNKFCSCKYLAANPDVFLAGINPLYHYLKFGRFEFRKKYALNDAFDENKIYNSLRINSSLGDNDFTNSKNFAVYILAHSNHQIHDYEIVYLEYLKTLVDQVIVVADAYIPPHELQKISHLISYMDCEAKPANIPCLYSQGYSILKNLKLLNKNAKLYFTNNNILANVNSLFQNDLKNANSDIHILAAYEADNLLLNWDFFIINYKSAQLNEIDRFFNNFLSESGSNSYNEALTDYLQSSQLTYLLIYPNKLQLSPDNQTPALPVKNLQNHFPFIYKNNFIAPETNREGVINFIYLLSNQHPFITNIIHNDFEFKNFFAHGPQFSIILPTYNRQDFILNAIDSVINQTYQNYELIIIDDGSTDETISLIKNKYEYLLKLGKFKLICLDENKGCTAARNIGLDNSSHEWICFLDSDNTWQPHFLEYFAISIHFNQYHQIFYSKFTEFPSGFEAGISFSRKRLEEINYIDLGVLVVHKEIFSKFGKFSSELPKMIDYEFILRITKTNKPFFIDHSLLNYNNDKHARITNTYSDLPALHYIKHKYAKTPQISIIVTSYNHEAYISSALESILLQDFPDIYEIIISDDGSNDATPDIINDYAKRFPWLIKNISNSSNIGISQNIKKCINAAKGKYIAFLEGDDFWNHPHKLSAQYEFLEKNLDCPMCFVGSLIFQESFEKIIDPVRQHGMPGKIDIHYLIQAENPVISFSSTLYRSFFLHNLPEDIYDLRLSEVKISYFLTQFGYLGFLPMKGLIYRQHSNSAWTGKPNNEKLYQEILEDLYILSLVPANYRNLILTKIESLKKELSHTANNEEFLNQLPFIPEY